MDSFYIYMILLLVIYFKKILSYYLDTSTSAQNLTCQSLTKVYRSPTTGTPRVMEFKINTAYGYNKLLYTLDLHVEKSFNSKLSFIESGKIIQEYEGTSYSFFSGNLCSFASLKTFIHFTSTTQMNEQQATLLIKIDSATTFWIKNLKIYAERCSQHCKICSDSSSCLECLPDFELNSIRQCICKEQFLTYFQGQCITQCPVNYIFDGFTCIQYAQLINLLYDDTASKFTLQPDYNTTQRVCQTTLGGKFVAGLFIQNEAIEYKINQPVGTATNILLEAEIYVLNYITNMQQRLSIKLNNNVIGHYLIIENGNFMNIQIVGAAKQHSCSIIGFTSCIKFIVLLNVENISDLSLISISINLPLEIKDISWALSYIKVNAITPLPIICPLKNYKNECVDKCPIHTRTSGNECISILNDYKFAKILRIEFTDRFAIKQNLDFDDPCDQITYFYHACYFYQNQYILGGEAIWQSKQLRIVNTMIQAHYKIKLFFKAILIDPINSDQTIIVSVDNQKYTLNMNSPNSYCFSSVATPGCIIQEDLGQTNPDYLINFEQEFDHSASQLEIFLYCNTKSPSITYCGLYDLVILLANCPPNCKLCSSDSICLQPESNIQVFYDCPSEGYFYSEGSCKTCQKFCKTCNSQTNCVACQDNYFQYGNICICKMNSKQAEITDCMSDNCHPSCSICQNQINLNTVSPYIKLNQLCAYCDHNEHKVLNINVCECFQGYYMDRSFIPSICQRCKETCKTCSDENTCITCFPDQNRLYYNYNCQCIDGYFETGFNPICIKCTTLCKSCLYKEDRCIKCYTEQYRILSKENTCVCQNGYYDNKADVCLKCSNNCNSCSDYSICTSCDELQFRVLNSQIKQCVCQEGYYDNNDLTCLPCYYTCSRCNNSNLISQCTLCPKTRQKSANNLDFFECKCRKGYFDNGYLECLSCHHVINPPNIHQCYSFCGDQIVQWNEECDDGNQVSRDGCDQCFIQNNNCIDNICLKCQYNQCLQCIDGYYINHDFACIQCSEECQTCESQQNNCIKCRFSNSNTEECLTCSQEHGFTNIDNQCLSICGDGIRTFQEFCDDGNLLNGDGCNQFCNIEDGYVCEVECLKINYIEILLQEDRLDNIYDSKRTIKLKFNQEIKISTNSSITSFVQITSNTPHLILTNISITDNSEFENGYYNIALDLDLELDSSAISPSINVIIQNHTLITNQQNQSFKTNRASIELIDFIKQDQIVIQNTKNLTQMSSYFLYILLGLAILAMIFGGLDIFWNLLDTLQLICYLKYFNITYPFNLQYYFTIFGFAEFDFIKTYFDFEYLITKYVDTPESDHKFYQEGYSTVFLLNIISVIIVFITTTTTFIIIKIVLYFLHKATKDFCEDIIMMETKQISIFTFLFYKLTNSCQKYFLKIICEFKSALIRTFMASAYDLNLAIFLQFKDLNFQNHILKLSSISALITFFLEIYFIYLCFQLMNKDLATLKLKETQQNYGSLFEGLKLVQNHFHHYFNLFVVIKKATFMAILVFLYDTPCLQISLVSILNLSQALLFLYNKPLEDQNELIKQIICELILWMSVMLILVYGFNEQTNILDSHQISNIGWMIIGFLSLILFLQLIIDCKQHFQFLDQKYQLFKRLRVWYNYYFQNNNNQSSLNTEHSQFSIVFNQRARQQTSAAKIQTQSNQVIQRRIISFKLS
ncbi:unnamed protein product (macronuclear) [Paramecium tetraurelia]|uniref:EGF-like domain-containing protein n=1 Tax=Paramecium tetraurelia TaxID=5888 RepID=A0BBC7_PARTE|nr:uncharacterized protein GSPATT00000279001 [Paramecium tetraurelia]CAK55844.1 unnamed protein product [Paramecium tetraurelia]|eukprot:XP_001423242.1 hypothetical protein (macronuclear) [Paramecium tetraurelia strain d4-2]